MEITSGYPGRGRFISPNALEFAAPTLYRHPSLSNASR
jgi:hypothetical protein